MGYNKPRKKENGGISMRVITKTIASVLLCTILIGLVPVTVFAQAQTPQASVADATLSASGTGSFGQMLSQELAVQQNPDSAMQYPYGYAVSSLKFQGNTAFVQYEAAEEALLLVGVYTEDGNKLLNSASIPVSAEAVQAEVTLSGEMPEYFYASAYLINPRDYVPLCDRYYTPMYTQQMQKLLSSTVDDYNSKLVWNMDDDETTNFAVFRYNVHQIPYKEGVNTLVSADNDTRTYVFHNCDKSFTSLWAGRIIAYIWQGQPLIIKISSISVDGTTVTITGGELEMSEVFQYIKIEGTGDTSDVIVKDDPDSPFVYVPQAQSYSLRTADDTMDGTEIFDNELLTFEVGEPDDGEDSGKPVDFGISGGLELKLNGYLDYYLAEDYQFLDVCMEYSATVNVSFEAGNGKDIPLNVPLLPMEWPLVIGVVSINFSPELHFQWSIGATVCGTVSGKTAFLYDSVSGASDHSSDPNFKTNVKLEGTVEFGIDWKPGVTVGGYGSIYILHVNLSLFTGVELTVTATSPVNETDLSGNPTVIHGCDTCIAGDFKPKFSLGLEIGFLCDWVVIPLDIWSADLPSFLTFYMSADSGQWEFGLGSCPNQAQRVAVHVKEVDDAPAENVTVTVIGTARKFDQTQLQEQPEEASGTASWTQTYTTDENGVAYIYLYSGAYLFSSLDMAVGRQIDSPCRIMIRRDDAVALDIMLEGGMEPADLLDPGVVAYGFAGAEGTSVVWTLYGSGELHIQGEGPMYEDWQTPWAKYREYIRTVYVHEGVTTVGNGAFAGCDRLVAADIADSVEHIGESAFSECHNLRKLQLSQNLKTLGARGFEDCRILSEITLPDSLTSFGEYCFYQCANLESVNIPHGITQIPEGAFRECKALTSLPLPESVTSIGEQAFYSCESLVSIVVPKGVTQIPEWAFGYCSALQSAVLPDGLTSIGELAFYYDSALIFCNIPSTVTDIQANAFAYCSSLQRVVLPQGLTAISARCFYACSSLTNTQIPPNVTIIGAKAFADCDNLTQMILPTGVTTIEQGAFAYCNALADVSIPDTVTHLGGGTTIGEVFPTGIFESCNSLTSISIPGSVDTIPVDTFNFCKNLSYVAIGEGVTVIDNNAFSYCESLSSIVIPASVTTFGNDVFRECTGLRSIYFRGSYPGIDNYTFLCTTSEGPLSAYYPSGDSSWTSASLPDENGLFNSHKITWLPWDPGSGAAEAAVIPAVLTVLEPATGNTDAPEDVEPAQAPAPQSAYEGEFATEFTEEGTLKTVRFTGLVPEASYLILNVATLDQQLLNPDNLLAVCQCTAQADGTLNLQYLQRIPTDKTYVLAFGIGNRNIAAASVTPQAMTSNGSVQSPKLKVTLNGRTLTEGMDYLLSGDVSFVLPGTYSCTLTGIGSLYGSQTICYTVSEQCPFIDVVKGKYYYEAVLWAVKKGITAGKTPTTFEPNTTVNRAQAVTFLWRAAGCPEPASQDNPFTDVGENNRFKDAILWAYHAGITSGKTATTFCPNDPCTRVQIVTFLYRFAGEPDVAEVENPFEDLSGGNRFYNAIMWAYTTGITFGKTATAFDLHSSCSRAQIVTFLYRYAG